MRRLLLPCLFTLCATSAHAGAWLQPEGHGLAITNATYFSSDGYWDAHGSLNKGDHFSKYELQPYAEYGLTQKLTIGGSLYAQHDRLSGNSNDGVADPEFFARAKLWDDGTQLISIQPLIKLPSTFARNSGTPRGGSKSTDAELSLLYGRSLNLVSNRDYLDARLGYRARNQGLNPQYKADIALGLSPWEHWQIIPAVRLVKAQSIVDTSSFSYSGDQDYTLLKAEVAAAYTLPSGDWIQASYFQHLSGEQTGNGDGVSIGYALRF